MIICERGKQHRLIFDVVTLTMAKPVENNFVNCEYTRLLNVSRSYTFAFILKKRQCGDFFICKWNDPLGNFF